MRFSSLSRLGQIQVRAVGLLALMGLVAGLTLIGFGVDRSSLKRAAYVLNLSPLESYTVTYVIDGDTIGVDTNERIRFLGVNTPELNSEDPFKVCLAKAAKTYVDDLLRGKQIWAYRDVSDIDKYGRLLRFVFLNKDDVSDLSLSVNYKLVREGYGQVLTIPPDVVHKDLFRLAQQQARHEKRGLWGSKCQKD